MKPMPVAASFEDGTLVLRVPFRLEFWDSSVISPDDAGLCAREMEVFHLLRKGVSNKEIAKYIGVEVRTAKYHVANLLGKLGCETRAEVIYKYGHSWRS